MAMLKKSLIVYLLSELFLLCLIETGEFICWNEQAVQILMYAAILLNSVVVAHFFFNRKDDKGISPDRYVAYAIFGTVASDFFMTLIGSKDTYLPGVIIICVIQMFYARYLWPARKSLVIRAIVFIGCLLALYFFGMLNLSNALGMLDLSLLLINVILAWIHEKGKGEVLFRIGITLFLCGDLIIACRTFATGRVHDVLNLLEWVFYIPSQVTIALSFVHAKKSLIKG